VKRTKQLRILSFGCSTGDEIEDILATFGDDKIKQIVGVDYNVKMVNVATERFKTNNKINIYESKFFDIPSNVGHFDIVVCCNVICRYATGNDDPIPHADFIKTVTNLWSMVDVGGVLLVIGANYLVSDHIIGETVCAHVVHGDSGPVQCYRFNPEDKSTNLIPRREAKMWALERLSRRRPKTVVVTPSPIPVTTTTTTTTIETKEVESPEDLLQRKPTIFGAPRTVTFGIFSYRRSKNIGDYAQSLAQINILSRFYRPTWTIESPALREAFEWLSSTKPVGPTVRQRNYDCNVTVVWLERDTTHTVPNPTPDGSKVYVIANAWYAHPDADGVYQFPFSDWVHPFMVSMHVAREEVIKQPGAIEYMREYGPVGCRDRDTAKLLRNLDVRCFYSGCLTYTLESEDLAKTLPSERVTNYKIDAVKEFINEGDVAFSHTMPTMLEQSFDQHLVLAMKIYKGYIKAKSIQSTRIHVQMPTRGLSEGHNLWFTSNTGSNDPSWNNRSRFSGLLEAMSNPRERNIRAMAVTERLTECIDRLLVDGLEGRALLDIWGGKHVESLDPYHEHVTQDIATIDDNIPYSWSSLRKTHPGRVSGLVGGALDTTLDDPMLYTDRSQSLSSSAIVDYTFRNVPIHAFEHKMDIVLTFDTNFVKIVRPFLCNLASANPKTLFRAYCFTRNVADDVYRRLLIDTMRITNVVLFNIPMLEKFEKYNTTLAHVSVCCMDRILVTDIDYPVDDVVNRLIYLDMDVLVYGDITPLNSMCTGRRGIIAKPSRAKNVIKNWLKKIGTSAVYHPTHSFNFGIAIFDLDKLRMLNFKDTCMDYHHKLNGANDQLISNLYAQGFYKKLPSKYNVYVGQDDKDHTLAKGLSNTGVMYHYAGSKKPWKYESAEEYPNADVLWQLWNVSEDRLKLLENPNHHFVNA
jgi:lipopolysaccharide biosynthesis glycosyltransferase